MYIYVYIDKYVCLLLTIIPATVFYFDTDPLHNRGMKTMAIRMERGQENAIKVRATCTSTRVFSHARSHLFSVSFSQTYTTHLRAYTHSHTHICTITLSRTHYTLYYGHTYTHTFKELASCDNIHTHTLTHTHAYTHIRVHTHTYTHTHIHKHTCAPCVRAHTCTHTYIYIGINVYHTPRCLRRARTCYLWFFSRTFKIIHKYSYIYIYIYIYGYI